MLLYAYNFEVIKISAASTDYLTKVGTPGTASTLAAPGYTIGDAGITVASTTNWPTTTGVIFAIDQYVAGKRVVGTYCEFEGVVTSSTAIGSLVLRTGTAQNYPAGSTTRVYIPVASSRENRLIDGLLVSLDQDGTLKAGAVDNAAALASNVVTTAKILDANVTPAKISKTPIFLTPKNAGSQSIGPGSTIARTGLTWTFTAPFTGYAECTAGLWGRPNTASTTDNYAYWLKSGTTNPETGGGMRGIAPGDNPGIVHITMGTFAITSGVSYTLAVYVNTSIATTYSNGSQDWGKVTLWPTEYYLAA